MKYLDKYQTILQRKPFRYLWYSRTISRFGDGVHEIALVLLVFALTGSATMMATVAICSLIPNILFSLFGGTWADKHNRKITMIFCSTARGALIIMLLLFYQMGLLTVTLICIIAFLSSILESFFSPAEFAVIPEVAGMENIQSAQALFEMSGRVVMIISLAVGGAIYGFFGVWAAFLIDSVSFFISAILISRISLALPAPVDRSKSNALGDIKEGLRYIYSNNILLTIFIMALLTNFGGAPLGIILPMYTADLSLSSGMYGYMMATLSMGMVVGFWIMGGRNTRGKDVILYSVLVGIFFILLFIPLLFKGYAGGGMALIFIFFGAIAIGMSNVPLSTIMQKATIDEFRGRVGSVGRMLSLISAPLSLAIFGPLTDKLGPGKVLVICGLLIVMCTIPFIKSNLWKIEY